MYSAVKILKIRKQSLKRTGLNFLSKGKSSQTILAKFLLILGRSTFGSAPSSAAAGAHDPDARAGEESARGRGRNHQQSHS